MKKISFEWDDEKNKINIQKHHLSFETASKAFYDPYFLEIEDKTHSETEQRYQGFGNINGIAVITLFYTERCTDGKERHRIISARGMDPQERKAYEQFIKSYTGTN